MDSGKGNICPASRVQGGGDQQHNKNRDATECDSPVSVISGKARVSGKRHARKTLRENVCSTTRWIDAPNPRKLEGAQIWSGRSGTIKMIIKLGFRVGRFGAIAGIILQSCVSLDEKAPGNFCYSSWGLLQSS